MWRSAENYARQLLSRRPAGFYPLLALYYLTYACDLRCPYCSDGSGQPYWRLRAPTLPARDVLALLATIRASCDHLVLTGGEPLLHPELEAILAGVPGLRFDSVIFTTNGRGVTAHLPALARAVTHLTFSLDTLDEAKADRWFGVGPGTLAGILAEIEAARRLPGRRYQIVISAVATPENLDDLHGVYDYCAARGYRFAVCPQLLGVRPHPALAGDPAYRRLYDRLIAEKRRGRDVNGSLSYLEHMRDLRRFDCRPSTTLAVAPGGDVLYPCLEIGKIAGNLLATPDLHAIRAEGLRRFGPEPTCPTQCHSACALGFALILGKPWTMLEELVASVRGVAGRLRR